MGIIGTLLVATPLGVRLLEVTNSWLLKCVDSLQEASQMHAHEMHIFAHSHTVWVDLIFVATHLGLANTIR